MTPYKCVHRSLHLVNRRDVRKEIKHAGQACVVQVEVLPDTASGDHKVKVMQVISNVWHNASSHVLGLLQEQRRALGLQMKDMSIQAASAARHS